MFFRVESYFLYELLFSAEEVPATFRFTIGLLLLSVVVALKRGKIQSLRFDSKILMMAEVSLSKPSSNTFRGQKQAHMQDLKKVTIYCMCVGVRNLSISAVYT